MNIALLNRNSNKSMVDELINQNRYLINEYFDSREQKKFTQTLKNIEVQQGHQAMQYYFNNIMIQLHQYEQKRNNYRAERAIARKHFGFFTDVEKSTMTTGKLTAAQNLKIDRIIEQNDEIIQLLRKLVEK